MFEFTKGLIETSKTMEDCYNSFYPVSPQQIAKAERRLELHFPADLIAFFHEVGCGFLRSPTGERPAGLSTLLNRFLDPTEIADLVTGVDESGPNSGFPEGDLPFIEIGRRHYMILRRTDGGHSSVRWPYGEQITPSLVEFVRRLMVDPRFYHAKENS